MFFRSAGQPLHKAHLIDFERRAKVRGQKEGGLSFFRLGLVSLRIMVLITRRRDEALPRGLAFTRARDFYELKYSFFGNPDDPGHVCMHCSSCNKAEAACECAKPPCPFARWDADDDDEVRDRLAGLMTVLVEASPTVDILKVFGTDVNEAEIAVANNTYISRWREYRQKLVVK